MLTYTLKSSFITLPLEIYRELAKFLDGPDLVELLFTHKRIGYFLIRSTKQWQVLYQCRFLLQDPKERDWLRWFIGGRRGPDGLVVHWGHAYVLRWQTEQNLQQGRYINYSILLPDNNELSDVVLSADHQMVVDTWTTKSEMLITFYPPAFSESSLYFSPVTSARIDRFDYSRFNYLEGSDFQLSDYYLVAFENLNRQTLYAHPLRRGVPFQVECGFNEIKSNQNDNLDSEDISMTIGVNLSTGNHMDIGTHWSLIIMLDNRSNSYINRMYHMASRRWCNGETTTPGKRIGFWGAAVWRETSISVTIAQLAINQSNQETDKILIQLWAFSLAAPIAQCRHSNLFSVSDDIQTDEKFDVSITLLHSDWLLISAVITAISCTVEIFYKPVINDTMPTSFSTTTSDLSSGNSWRIRRDGLRSSAPFMIGTDKVGIQKNSSNISIHLLQDGALLWNCPVSTGMYSPLLSNILLTRSNNIAQFTDINQRQELDTKLDISHPSGAGRYIASYVTETNSINIYDFSHYSLQ